MIGRHGAGTAFLSADRGLPYSAAVLLARCPTGRWSLDLQVYFPLMPLAEVVALETFGTICAAVLHCSSSFIAALGLQAMPR